MDNTRSNKPSSMNTGRAGCDESRTSGSEGGPEKPTNRKTDRALRPDPYIIGHYSTALATLVERVTRYTLLVPLPGRRTMDALNTAIADVFADLPAVISRSLTWDQGHEIAGHAQLANTTGLDVYLCNPHSPWQRGTNENTNGLLRQWFPRSTNFYALDHAEIERVAESLNNRPRRILDWRTPTEAFQAIT